MSNCLIVYFSDCLTVWLSYSLTVLLVSLSNCLIVKLINCLYVWLSDCLIVQLSECRTVWMSDCLIYYCAVCIMSHTIELFRSDDVLWGKCKLAGKNECEIDNGVKDICMVGSEMHKIERGKRTSDQLYVRKWEKR